MAINAAATTLGPAQVTLTVESCRAGDADLHERVRRRWLERVHPEVRVVDVAAQRDRAERRELPGQQEARLAAADPVSHWSLLHPIVQGDLTVRVSVVGTESTGKTTLVRALAKSYNTHEVAEFGREYTVAKRTAGTNDVWTTDDFVRIAQEQQRLEDLAAVGAGPLFFCDTDAMTTALWHERYQGHASATVDAIGRARRYDLFVLCDIDIAWERDEIRLGAETRAAMHARFVDVLTHDRREPWVLVAGTVDQRMATVDRAIDDHDLLQAHAIFDPRRQHLH